MSEVQSPPGYLLRINKIFILIIHNPAKTYISWGKEGPLGSFAKSTKKFAFKLIPPFSVSTSSSTIVPPFFTISG